MIVKVCNADYSLQWDGTYQFALENYPKIQEWELEKLAKFIAYEQDHHRQTIVECENHELTIQIHDYLKKHSYFPLYRPSHQLVASTYDILVQWRWLRLFFRLENSCQRLKYLVKVGLS